jgi:hypothetical protein
MDIQSTEWEIGLASWIIQDGNYSDFATHQRAEFALEFYPRTIERREQPAPAKYAGRTRYDLDASIVLLTDEVWVLDFGLRAFQETRPPGGNHPSARPEETVLPNHRKDQRLAG